MYAEVLSAERLTEWGYHIFFINLEVYISQINSCVWENLTRILEAENSYSEISFIRSISLSLLESRAVLIEFYDSHM